jgi:hypothetical protein
MGTDRVYRATLRSSAVTVPGGAMPRRSRITVAEVPVHIIQRGNTAVPASSPMVKAALS